MGDLSSYYLLLLRYFDFKILLTLAQMFAYNKTSTIQTGTNFSKVESRDLPQSINPKFSSILFSESYLFLEFF